VNGPAGGAVVIGVDDGLLRTPVLDAAVAAAHRLGREVHLIHGHGPAEDGAVRQDDAGLRAEAYLRRTAPGLEVRRTCAEGEEPAETLVVAAEGAALLVLGDRSRRLGSEAGRTTDEVMIRAGCPVLVVGKYREVPGAPRRHAVVVGVDDSAHGRVVLDRALDAAEMLGCPVEAIRICEDVLPVEGGLLRREVDAGDLAEAHGELDAVVRSTAGRSLPVTTRAVADRPARALLEAGRGADLIVVGHRADDGARPPRLGSTARAVLAAAPCPVLVVGPTAGSVGSVAPPGGAERSGVRG
jgi:nucleotide-binding universal stress UspA family protein